jgi:hypothetical protein
LCRDARSEDAVCEVQSSPQHCSDVGLEQGCRHSKGGNQTGGVHVADVCEEGAAVTVNTEELGWRGMTSSWRTTGSAPEFSPTNSACVGDAVLHTSTRGTVPMGQCDGCHRGQHLTVHISTNDLHY